MSTTDVILLIWLILIALVFYTYEIYTRSYSSGFGEGLEMGKKIEKIDAQSKTGYWIEIDTDQYACSNCHHCFSIDTQDNSIKEYKLCPNCGFRMNGQPKESEKV